MTRWGDTALRRWALALFGATVAFALGRVLLFEGLVGRPARTHPGVGPDYSSSLWECTMAAAALLLLWHRPRNSVGWYLGAAGFFESLGDVGQSYGERALAIPEEHLPFGATVLAFSSPFWVWGVVLPVTCLLLRYPTGEITGSWARRVDRGVKLGLVLEWVVYAGSLSSVTDEIKDRRPPVVLPAWVELPGWLLVAVCVLGGIAFSLAHTLVRTLRASYPERQQLALLATLGPSAVLLLLSPYQWTQTLLFLIPLAIVVGVLRYRLMGIELVVRRALLYGSLTGVTLLVFVAVTSALTALVPRGPAPQVVAASVVAVGLVPLRDRLKRGVDRFVYGDRGDPLAALKRLSTPLGVSTPEALLPEVLAGVAASLRVPGAEVVGQSGTRAVVGSVPAGSVDIPLVMGGEGVGVLRLAPRPGESHLPHADGRLVEGLAPLVAAVLHTVELAAALQVEQERVVAATEIERARLRQELHDGLGPSLTGIGLGLEALESRVGASDLVDRLRAETATSLEEVRRIIDGLRPGALESADLLSLLRIRAQHLSATAPVRVIVAAPDRLPVLPEEVETAALRIVDEALTNVVRHASATTCTVTIALDDELRVEVRDDGCGYDGPRYGGVGVDSMRARAERLGGCCEVLGSSAGTVVTVRLPVGVAA